MTLKYNQGHWKWYEWVQLNEFYHDADFDIYHIYSVQENHNVKVFAIYGQLAGKPAGQLSGQLAGLTLIITWDSYFSRE